MRETQNGWEFEKVQKKFEQQKLQELQNIARPDVPINMNNQWSNQLAQNNVQWQVHAFAQPPVPQADINFIA